MPDIEELFARMAPATTPAEALNYAETIADFVRPFNPHKSVEVFAGLMTDPRFQAHQVRLDFAIRIILGVARRARLASAPRDIH